MKYKIRNSIVGLMIVLTLTTLVSLPKVNHFHGLDIDVLHWLRANFLDIETKLVDSHTVVVAIDEMTHASPPFKGIPKVMWTPQIAKVQAAILTGGATVLGWDIILPTSASTYLNDNRFDQALLKGFIRERDSGRIVLGQAQINTQKIAPHRVFAMTVGGEANIRNLDISLDNDGISRSLPLFLEMKTKSGKKIEVPGMAMELAARTAKERPQLTSEGVQFLAETIPGSKFREIALNFDSRPGAIPTYSFADLYECAKAGREEYFREAFANKAVLFGSVLDIEDRRLSSNRFITRPDFEASPSPCIKETSSKIESIARNSISGVYLHATAVNNLLNSKALKLPSGPVRIATSLMMAVIGVLLVLTLSLFTALFGLTLFGVLWVSLATWLMQDATVLPLIESLFVMFVASILALSYRFIIVDRDKRFLRQKFSSYVSPNLVEVIVDNPDGSVVAARHQECSFIFTDLAGFTTMVETLSPEVLRSLMSDYIDGMTDIVFEYNGTLDKVIGDALCIFFSAPIAQKDHAQRAVECALKLDAWSRNYSINLNQQGIKFGKTRIGVNSGEAVVGNFGGSSMFDYTAYGDTVNIAARLESANKQLGTNICISSYTVENCTKFVGRPVGKLLLKGRSIQTQSYEPLREIDLKSPAFKAYIEAYRLMEELDPKAEETFAKAAADFPNDALIKYHYQRLKNGQTGTIIVLTEK